VQGDRGFYSGSQARINVTFGPPNDWRDAAEAEFLDRELSRNSYLCDLVSEFGAARVEATSRQLFHHSASAIETFDDAGAIRRALNHGH
jgi:hypothetical protein